MSSAIPTIVDQALGDGGPFPSAGAVRTRARRGGDVAHVAHRLERHDPLAIGIRQRVEEQSVDDAEDRAVGADAERQREHGHRGEHRCPGEMPECEAHVLHPFGQPYTDVLAAGDVPCPSRRVFVIFAPVAEAGQRRRRGVGLTEPAGAQLVGPRVDVEADLLVGVREHAVARRREAEQPADAGRKPAKRTGHGRQPGSRMLVTTAT
jgi:hypothetical protein